MRRVAWTLLVLFAFTVPWEYSLDLGAPWGNVARIVGLALLAVAIAAVFQSASIRRPGSVQWLTLIFVLWLCSSALWSIDPRATAAHLPGYLQETMIVWLLWELVEGRDDLYALLDAYVAGAWVLAALTIGNFLVQGLPDQVRFVPQGQDPNDVARFLVLGLPMAALLIDSDSHWARRLVAIGYLPVASVAVLLTASRGGSLAGVLSLAGCALILARRHARIVIIGAATVPLLAADLWMAVPHETLLRLGSIPGQLMGGDLNQRWNIWAAGWNAFARAPIEGWGAGSFVLAAGLAPIDTAHNTALAIGTEGGLIALAIAVSIVIASLFAVRDAERQVCLALGTATAAWIFLSLVSTVQESRTTWLLLGLNAVAGRVTRHPVATRNRRVVVPAEDRMCRPERSSEA